MMSACVKWAKEQLDEFNKVLGRQLSSVQVGSPTWRDCVGRAREHAGMMGEVGLDFRELVRVRTTEGMSGEIKADGGGGRSKAAI